MARVESINISKEKGTIKQSVDKAMLIENFGIENDAHAGKWHRSSEFTSKRKYCNNGRTRRNRIM